MSTPSTRLGAVLRRLSAGASAIAVAVLSGPNSLTCSPLPIPPFVLFAITSSSSPTKGRRRQYRCTACGESYPAEELRVERDEEGRAIGLLCPLCY